MTESKSEVLDRFLKLLYQMSGDLSEPRAGTKEKARYTSIRQVWSAMSEISAGR